MTERLPTNAGTPGPHNQNTQNSQDVGLAAPCFSRTIH
jgi:hypothetical protein